MDDLRAAHDGDDGAVVELAAASRLSATSAAVASAFVPGAGQFMQRRYGTGLLHFGTVTAYVVMALSTGRLWLTVAVVFNVWSVIDAVWWARTSDDDGGAVPPSSPGSRS